MLYPYGHSDDFQDDAQQQTVASKSYFIRTTFKFGMYSFIRSGSSISKLFMGYEALAS